MIAYLRKRSSRLGDLIEQVLFKIRYTFDRDVRLLPQEAEMRLVGQKFWGQKPKVVRKGLPQGLSISPILATMVMDFLPPIEGLIMYADDGIIMSRDDSTEKIAKWLKDVEIFGMKLEPEKSGLVEKKFKFLGVEFDLEEETAKYNEGTLS